jgi:phage tail sheath protein FI
MASFQVSPGVEINEVDLTNVVPAVSTSIGAYVGGFRWGPVEEIVQVTSENDLVNRFFAPDDNTFKYFMPAAQFLQYANDLRVVRANQSGMLNASQTAGVLVKNESDYEQTSFSADNHYVAKYPGDLGNSLGVYVASNATAFASADFTDPGYDELFDFAPGTSDWASDRGIENDELHVVVVDEDGVISGTEGQVLEIFQGLSQASDAKRNNGQSNYYVNVINNQSSYIWVGSSDSDLPDSGVKSTDTTNLTQTSTGHEYETSDTVLTYDFTGGLNGTAAEPTVGELQTGYDLFDDAETVDVNFLIGAPVSESDDVTLANDLIAIAEGRKDVVAFVSPSTTRSVNNTTAATDIKSWADQITSSSYGVLDSGALYVYDKYNDVYRWVIASGDVAGLCAFTDNVSDPWFSPAGFNRGQIRGVTKVAFNPRKAERDTLYKARVNPIVAFPGQGIVLFGDKTAQAKPSAFDRINVRRLFITLEKAVSTAAKFQLFELNDEFTRAQFRNLVEPFLRDVQGRRGVTAFSVVCDETNNTPQVIDANRFVADIYIQPARSINFISLNFIATRTGVEFSEIAGQ